MFAYGDWILFTGWLDTPLARTDAQLELGQERLPAGDGCFQYFREDANAAIGVTDGSKLGFVGLVEAEASAAATSVVFRIGTFVQQATAISTRTAAEFVGKALSLLSEAVRQGGSTTVLYSLPEGLLDRIKRIYRRMLDEQDLPGFHLRSNAPTQPACSFIFTQMGRLPLLPLILDSMSELSTPFEVIVANNSRAFREQTLMALTEAEILHGIPWQYIEPETNIGFGPACNRAARLARGRSVVFHNNDILAANGSNDYGAIVRALQADPPAIVGARQYFPSGGIMHDGLQVGMLDPVMTGGHAGIYSGLSQGRGRIPGQVGGPIFASGSLLGIDKALFELVGGFSEDYMFGHFEDLDLCLRLHAKGTPTTIVHDVHFIHCEGAGSEVPEHIAATVPTLNRMTFSRSWSDVASTWIRSE